MQAHERVAARAVSGEDFVAAGFLKEGAPEMGLKRYVATAGALAISVLMAGAVSAQATVFEHGTFSFEENDVTEQLCGIAVVRDTVARGEFRTRAGTGELDQAFFSHSSVKFTDTYTKPATGETFSVDGIFNQMDVKATPLGGNIFEFKFRDSGITVVRDADGDVVARDRGAIWFTMVFDTLGDSMPGGETVSETVDRVSGPHPLFEEDAFCATVHDLIG